MTIDNSGRCRKGVTPLGRIGLVIILSGLTTATSMAQNARPAASRFSLAGFCGSPGQADDSRTIGIWLLEAKAAFLSPASDIRFQSSRGPVKASREAAAKAQKPSVRGTRVAAQILAGAAVGVLGCAVVALTASESTVDDDKAYIAAMTAGGLVAGALVAPGLVYLIGSGGRQTGSLGVTYLGGLAGAAVCAIIFAAASSSDADGAGGAALAGAVLIPAIGSVIGFITTRRYKSLPAVQTALLNLGQGKLKLGIPSPQVFFSGNGKKSPGLAVRIFQADL